MDVIRAADLSRSGISMRLIALELGVVESTVSRKLSNAEGGSPPSPLKMPGVADSDIIRLHFEGEAVA